MKSEILGETSLTGIKLALVWTLDKFPDYNYNSEIPDHYKTPTYIYLNSGEKSNSIDFLKYATIHDTEDSWNPADLYGPKILEKFGRDSEAYQTLEKVLLPEIVELENFETDIKFFSTVSVFDSILTLIKLPEKAWKVEFYSEDDFEYNYKKLLIPSELRERNDFIIYPTLRVTYGPGPELLNNSDDMYYTVPEGRTDSVVDITYKNMVDELESRKVLAIEFSPTGVNKISTLNLSAGAWKLEEEPERHKQKYFVGTAEIRSNKNIDIVEDDGNLLIDKLSGTLIGTTKLNSTPVKNYIHSQRVNSDDIAGYLPYNPHVVYKKHDKVKYNNRVFVSNINNNIDNNPSYSNSWSLDGIYKTRFEEEPLDYRTVEILTVGPGKIYYPVQNSLGEYLEITGKVGTIRDYVKLRIVPDPGYRISGLSTYSYFSQSQVSNLTTDGTGNYILRIGGSYGYSFYVKFVRVDLTVVSDFCVPGINYYTYMPDTHSYRDIDEVYNSLSGTTRGNIKSLPSCSGMSVSYTIDNSPIKNSVVSILDGVYITIPGDSEYINSGKTMKIMYHNLYSKYTVSSVQCHYYSGDIVTSVVDIEDTERDGNSLVVYLPVTEAVCHIKLNLVPKKIPIIIKSDNDIFELSTEGAYVNIGEKLEFEIYGNSLEDPNIDTGDLFANSVIEQISSKLWKVTISDIQMSGTITVS